MSDTPNPRGADPQGTSASNAAGPGPTTAAKERRGVAWGRPVRPVVSNLSISPPSSTSTEAPPAYPVADGVCRLTRRELDSARDARLAEVGSKAGPEALQPSPRHRVHFADMWRCTECGKPVSLHFDCARTLEELDRSRARRIAESFAVPPSRYASDDEDDFDDAVDYSDEAAERPQTVGDAADAAAAGPVLAASAPVEGDVPLMSNAAAADAAGSAPPLSTTTDSTASASFAQAPPPTAAAAPRRRSSSFARRQRNVPDLLQSPWTTPASRPAMPPGTGAGSSIPPSPMPPLAMMPSSTPGESLPPLLAAGDAALKLHPPRIELGASSYPSTPRSVVSHSGTAAGAVGLHRDRSQGLPSAFGPDPRYKAHFDGGRWVCSFATCLQPIELHRSVPANADLRARLFFPPEESHLSVLAEFVGRVGSVSPRAAAKADHGPDAEPYSQSNCAFRARQALGQAAEVCAVCGFPDRRPWKTYPKAKLNKHGSLMQPPVTMAHVLSPEALAHVGYEDDERNYIPLCGTLGWTGTCHDAFDKNLMLFAYEGSRRHNDGRFVVWASNPIYRHLCGAHVTLPSRPHRSGVHARARHALTSAQVLDAPDKVTHAIVRRWKAGAVDAARPSELDLTNMPLDAAGPAGRDAMDLLVDEADAAAAAGSRPPRSVEAETDEESLPADNEDNEVGTTSNQPGAWQKPPVLAP